MIINKISRSTVGDLIDCLESFPSDVLLSCHGSDGIEVRYVVTSTSRHVSLVGFQPHRKDESDSAILDNPR